MTVKLLTEHHLESLSLKEAYTGSSKSTLVKMPNCWKSHFAAHFYSFQNFNMKATGLLFLCCFVRLVQYVFMDEECTMTLKETGYDFVVGE